MGRTTKSDGFSFASALAFRYLCTLNQTAYHMKRPIFPVIRLKIWLCLLWACLAQNIAWAQNGITVYSDTVSALEDVADDSTWNTPPSVYSHTFSLMEDLGNEGILDFMSGLLGIGGVLLTVLTVILFLIPVLLVLLVVYLIYRSHREKNMRIERSAYDPEKRMVDDDRRNQLLKQSAIKNACWGVGLIVIEWIIDFTDLLYVVGVVMLCIAANDWLTTLIKKNLKSATPFPKCYLHKEKWTFDS